MSAADDVDVSLIIATRNRCEQLVRCLDAIRYMTFERPWELIIVDNGSFDATATLVRDFIDTTRVPGLYLSEPSLGKSNALNTALAIARGKILAFTDDDCYPAADILSNTWSAFADPSVGYITGRIILHDSSDYPVTINESPTPLTFPARSLLKAGDVHGANMAFRRTVLLDIGGFDPLFGAGALFAGEDLDAAGRASAMGWKGLYCPEVVVRHHHGRKMADIPRLMKFYGIGAGAYHMKLLLAGHEFRWFVQSLYTAPQRSKFGRRMLLWEPVGIVKYAYLWLTRSIHNRFRRAAAPLH